MDNKVWKYIAVAIMIVLLCLGSFLIGRKTIERVDKTTVEYVQGDTIQGSSISVSVNSDYPTIIDSLGIAEYLYREGRLEYLTKQDTKQYGNNSHIVSVRGSDTRGGVFVDTIDNHVKDLYKVDTAAIIKDFIVRNHYDVNVFDNDTIGKCNIHFDVQYNNADNITYTYVPITKVVTNEVVKIKIAEPYIGLQGGVSMQARSIRAAYIGLEAGVFIREHYGFGVQANVLSDGTALYGAKLTYKF